MIDKIFDSLQAAVADIHDGATVMIGGFGTAGMPSELIDALIEQGALERSLYQERPPRSMMISGSGRVWPWSLTYSIRSAAPLRSATKQTLTSMTRVKSSHSEANVSRGVWSAASRSATSPIRMRPR